MSKELKQEQKSIYEITKKIEQNDMKYFQNPNILYLTSRKFSDYRWTILHLAVWHNRYQILSELLQKPEIQSLVNCIDSNSETPLHLAFYDRKHECTLLLLQYGAKFDIKNQIKQRPVDVVAGKKENQIQFLQSLMKQKVSSNEDVKQMLSMLKRRVNKIKSLNQHEMDDYNEILLTKSDTMINSNQLLLSLKQIQQEMENSCIDEIPLEACPNQILEFKTKHFIHLLDYYSTTK
ncbi:hypothetical protein ABPG72_003237 [Tetrahymena utriculariae]